MMLSDQTRISGCVDPLLLTMIKGGLCDCALEVLEEKDLKSPLMRQKDETRSTPR